MKNYYRVQFFVGLKYDRDGEPVNVPSRAGLAALLQYFTGVTASVGNGAWTDDKGEVVQEHQVTYTVLVEEYATSDIENAARLAAEILKSVYRQSAVLVTVEPVRAEFV
jgi:hypothetical protein